MVCAGKGRNKIEHRHPDGETLFPSIEGRPRDKARLRLAVLLCVPPAMAPLFSTNLFAARPTSDPSLISSRSRSPVLMCAKGKSASILFEIVPFPLPVRRVLRWHCPEVSALPTLDHTHIQPVFTDTLLYTAFIRSNSMIATQYGTTRA